jgi:uncharacterized protein (DUF58 family)
MSSAESYLKPDVIRRIKRLDLRAEFLVKGFMQGLHASPYHGFSVEFSEHRKYAPGDDPKDIDWTVYGKTDKYYVKKFEAETNIQGYLVMDLSSSMGYTHRQEMTKFEYSICLAAALAYLMTSQNDAIGLVTYGEAMTSCLAPKSKRRQLGNILAQLSRMTPAGKTQTPKSLQQVAGLLKRQSLIMLFSDLLDDEESIYKALLRLRHGGHDVILFHVLDEAEVTFPFDGSVELIDPESDDMVEVDARDFRESYLAEVSRFREDWKRKCAQSGIDYVPLDTSMPFDKALSEYLISRRARF